MRTTGGVKGVARRGTRWTVFALVAAALLAPGCKDDNGRGTPDQSFATLRAAIVAQDGPRVFELQDADCRAFHLQRIRTVRARLERGDPPNEVLGEGQLSPETFTTGTPEQAAGKILMTRSELLTDWEWIESATVVETQIEEIADGQDRARMLLRAADGEESEIYFVKEPAGWAYDQFRLRQERMNVRWDDG